MYRFKKPLPASWFSRNMGFKPAILCFSLVCIALISGASIPADAQLITGTPPFGSFSGGPFDTVNLANLDVHFAIPILNNGGRGLPFSYALTYDSLVWTPTTQT